MAVAARRVNRVHRVHVRTNPTIQLYTTAGGSPPHRHIATIDTETGNGITDMGPDAHAHRIAWLALQRAPDGHSHQITEERA